MLAAVCTIPFPFVGRPLRLLWGVPLWLWWSFCWTAALAGLTAWGILRYWSDDDDG